MKEKLITLRLPQGLDDELGKIAKSIDTDKSKLMREFLLKGIQEKKIEESLKLYVKGKISLARAAELSGISLWEIMDIVREKKIPAQYTMEQLEADLEPLRKKNDNK